MAMNVKFLQGSSTNFNKITTKEANTFYYVTDKKALYLGANLIGDGVSTEAFEALARRVKTLEDWKALLATETSKTSASTTSIPDLITVTVKTKDGAVSGVSINDSALRSLISSYVTNVTFNTYKQEQGSRDDGQDSKIAALEETVEGIVNVGGEANLVDDVQINGTTIVADKIANLAVEGNYSSINKIATMSTVLAGVDAAKGYTNDEITGLEFALSADGKTLELKNKSGTAVATLDTTDFVVDGMLSSVVADQDNNKLTFTWNTDSGIKVTEIELSAIADIYTGSTNNDGISINVSNTNEISAVISSALEARIAKGETALGWGNHADAGYAIAKDLGALATKDTVLESDLNSAVQTKLNNGDVAYTTLTSGTVSINSDTSNSSKITITAFGKTSTGFMVPYAVTAGSTPSAGNADKLGNQLPAYYATAQSVADINTAIGSQQTDGTSATGIYASIQGSTTNTVKDCVDAINALNQGKMEANKNIEAITLSLSDVENQLTWGSF